MIKRQSVGGKKIEQRRHCDMVCICNVTCNDQTEPVFNLPQGYIITVHVSKALAQRGVGKRMQ